MAKKNYVSIANKYIEGVLSGKIAACEWVRLACQRQKSDLANDSKWIFRKDKANQVCAFIELLPHVKGRWKTSNLTLEPWQCFLLTTIFGWYGADGYRRFRRALTVIPRKNGKSPLAAGVGLYLMVLDGEPGAEIYSVATTRDQAKIVWGEYARKMILQNPKMRAHYGIEALAHSITVESTGSFFRPLSRDANSLEGLQTHGAIIDELHAHESREVFDVINDSIGARRQPLIFMISTEGDNSEGVFAEELEYGCGVLRGTHEDDSYFCIIYTLDKEDDWTHPESWAKANPNLGVSVFEKDMEIRCRQAMASADSQASFLTKRLNVRVGASQSYFNVLAWNTICKTEGLLIEDFAGQPCIITLDLASKRDLTTKITVFKRGDTYYVFGRHYLPSDAISEGKPNYDFYRGWASSGNLVITEGNITDYDFVERDLLDDMRELRPYQVGCDPNYNAGQLTTRMQAQGVPMVDVAHNVATFSEPMKSLEALIVSGRIKHNGDPVLSWAIANVIAKKDAKDNVYPRKRRDEQKIDPAVALIANLSLQLRLVEETSWDFKAVAI